MAAVADERVIDISEENGRQRVVTLTKQEGFYDYQDLVSEWPKELLFGLAMLKQDWFWDSYARFEHPNYIQKATDITLGLYGISLPGKRVLDFGGGYGASTHCLIKRGADNVVMADLNPRNTDFARSFFECVAPQKVNVFHGDITKTIGKSEYDIIWVHAVIEHLTRAERREYLPKFWAALRPGGYLVILETPNRNYPFETHTTGGRWWLPWMRDQAVFAKLRKDEKYRNWTDEEFYRSGVIGSTYTELMDCLRHPPDCEELGREVRGYIKRLYRAARVKTVPRWTLVTGMAAFEPVWKLATRKPACSFMPYLHHLAFRKKA